MFYKDGLANGCRQLFLDYIWYEKFSAQFGLICIAQVKCGEPINIGCNRKVANGGSLSL